MNAISMTETKPKRVTKDANPYLDEFERLIKPTAGKHPSWLFPLRKAGIARFAEIGLSSL